MTVREAVAILSAVDQDLPVGFSYFDEIEGCVIDEVFGIEETRCRDIDDSARKRRVVVLSGGYEGDMWVEEKGDE